MHRLTKESYKARESFDPFLCFLLLNLNRAYRMLQKVVIDESFLTIFIMF